MPQYYVQVIVAQHKTPPLVYHITKKLPLGSIVKIPIRSSICHGIIHAYTPKPTFATKEASPLGAELTTPCIHFLHTIAHFTAQSVSSFLTPTLTQCTEPISLTPQAYKVDHTCLSTAQKKILKEHKILSPTKALTLLGPRLFTSACSAGALKSHNAITSQKSFITLTTHQKKAVQLLEGKSLALLEGVTGSGKTETFTHWALPFLSKGKQVLILTPTINLAEQTALRIQNATTEVPIRWHAMTSPAYKKIVWHMIACGAPCIVVGARSALFLPFCNLGCIVVDEEHDNCSYKQESHPVYHTRSAAYLLARAHNCPLLFSTATPSMEIALAVKNKACAHAPLSHSFHTSKRSWRIVDMRALPQKTQGFLSPELCAHIKRTIDSKNLTLLFINRRGFAPLTLCTQCGFRITCAHCSAFLTYHKKNCELQCHHCHITQDLPHACPQCAHAPMKLYGPAVECIEEEVRTHFPQAHTLLLSSDTLTSPKKLEEAHQKIKNHGVDIIVSTRVLSTGIDLQKLALVGFVDTELGQSFYDIRANEHAFQLIMQTAGRCGRHTHDGTVVIQTFNPSDPLLTIITETDKAAFVQKELQDRKMHKLPPYYKVALIHLQGKNKQKLESFAQMCLMRKPQTSNIEVLGPSESPMPLRKGKHRLFFLIRCKKKEMLLAFLKSWLTKIPRSRIDITVDTEPVSFI